MEPLYPLFNYGPPRKAVDSFIERSEFITVKPSEKIDIDQKVYTFTLGDGSLHCYDLQNVSLSAFLSIKSNEGGMRPVGWFSEQSQGKDADTTPKITTFDPVCLNSLPLDALFEKVVVMFNDQVVFTTNLHQFRSFFEKSVSYSEKAKKTTIASQQYEHTYYAPGNLQIGLLIMGMKTQLGQELFVSTKLRNDAFNIPAYVPGNVKITVQLHRSSEAFSLTVNSSLLPDSSKDKMDQYFCAIRDLSLTYKRVLLTETGRAHMAQAVERPMYFTCKSTRINQAIIPAGALSWDAQLGGLPYLPGQMFIGLVPVDHVYGRYDTNSLCFKHHHLNEVTLKFDDSVLDKVTVASWTSNGIMNAYNKLLYTLKLSNAVTSIDMYPERFLEGPLTVFALVGGNDIYDQFERKTGRINIMFKFSKPTPAPGLAAIIFSPMQSTITINKGMVTFCDLPEL
jgi:hypothetical protein